MFIRAVLEMGWRSVPPRSKVLLFVFLALGACTESTVGFDAWPADSAPPMAHEVIIPTVHELPDSEYEVWSIAVLPDTQVYSYSFPEIFDSQTRWISEHASEMNIRFALHVGDITDFDTTGEWDNATNSLALLEGVVPFAVVPGNHDYTVSAARESRISEYFPASEFQQQPNYGGLFEEGTMDNSYQLFDIGDESWLVLALEWGPRDEVLTWANEIATRYSEYHAIVLTHAYLYFDNTRYDWQSKGPTQSWNPHSYPEEIWPQVNDGEEIWQKLVSLHANMQLVISGHVLDDGVGRLTSEGAGTQVHQLVANFQTGVMGGSGYMRLLEVHEDEIVVRTYSPYLDHYLRGPDHEFVLPRSQ